MRLVFATFVAQATSLEAAQVTSGGGPDQAAPQKESTMQFADSGLTASSVASVPPPQTPAIQSSSPGRTESFEVLLGDARELVRSLDRQVNCCVTSPPYFQVKHYGADDKEIGWETSVDRYIRELCELFDAIPFHERASL